jgi:hypothetical protein
MTKRNTTPPNKQKKKNTTTTTTTTPKSKFSPSTKQEFSPKIQDPEMNFLLYTIFVRICEKNKKIHWVFVVGYDYYD